MTLPTAAYSERGIHVHVMAGKVQANKQLEDHAPSRSCNRQEDQQAGGRASVRHHI